MITELKNVKKIYFFDNGYGVRGGANFMLEIIRFLLDNSIIPVGLIDFKDGYMRESLIDRNIDFVDYEEDKWDIEPESLIFCPVERLCLLKPLVNKEYNTSVKVITILWETMIGWELLYPNHILKKYADLLFNTDSLMFLDAGCQFACENQLKRKFKDSYLPLYFHNSKSTVEPNNNIINENEINIAWLGRLSDTKCFSLLNLIKHFNQINTSKTKRIHIIGDGLYKKELIKDIEKINDLNVDIIFKGVLTGNELNSFLTNNVDILFAMGTSMLNGASISLPVAGVSETSNHKLNLDRFIWLYDEKGLQLGLPDKLKKINKINPKAVPLQTILDEIYEQNKKSEIASKCYEYYKFNHSNIERDINILFENINNSTLTYKKLNNLFKFMPYNKVINQYYKFLGIPFIHIIRKGSNTIYKVFGIRLLKIKNYNLYNRKYKLFGLFTIASSTSVGRYRFPNIFSKKLQK